MQTLFLQAFVKNNKSKCDQNHFHTQSNTDSVYTMATTQVVYASRGLNVESPPIL